MERTGPLAPAGRDRYLSSAPYPGAAAALFSRHCRERFLLSRGEPQLLPAARAEATPGCWRSLQPSGYHLARPQQEGLPFFSSFFLLCARRGVRVLPRLCEQI